MQTYFWAQRALALDYLEGRLDKDTSPVVGALVAAEAPPGHKTDTIKQPFPACQLFHACMFIRARHAPRGYRSSARVGGEMRLPAAARSVHRYAPPLFDTTDRAMGSPQSTVTLHTAERIPQRGAPLSESLSAVHNGVEPRYKPASS